MDAGGKKFKGSRLLAHPIRVTPRGAGGGRLSPLRKGDGVRPALEEREIPTPPKA